MELVVVAIDLFNKKLEESESEFQLSSNQSQIKECYNMYMARKNHQPKDDLPELGMASSIKVLQHTRFALGLGPKALVSLSNPLVVS